MDLIRDGISAKRTQGEKMQGVKGREVIIVTWNTNCLRRKVKP